jgi:hypothetical protein
LENLSKKKEQMAEEQITLLDDWSNWRDLPHDHFVYDIMRGREGAFVGLHNGLDRINKYIHGTQMGKIYLLGADSGGGKTTVSDYMFPISSWLDAKAKGQPVKVFYCSFEVSRRNKEAKWCSHYIGWRYGVSLPIDYLLGRIENNYLRDDELYMVKAGWQFVTEIMKDIVLLDESTHPTAIYESMVKEYEKYGEVIRVQSEDDKKKGRKGKVVRYKPKDEFENMLCMLMIDHLKLTSPEQGLDTKKTMDRMSGYCVKLKNRFKTTSVILQQFNSELQYSRRESVLKNGGKDVEAYLIPNKLDFGDSKATYENADYVIGLVQPSAYQLEKFYGYDCSPMGMGGFMIAMFLMKNRESGQANILCPLFMNPVASLVYDLNARDPKAPDMAEDIEWLSKAHNLRKELARFVPIKIENDGDNTSGPKDGSNATEP